MSQWFSKVLGGGVEAFSPSGAIQTAFLQMYVASGKPVNMAVFSRYDVQNNLVTVYFSPGASALANMFDAEPCEKPSFTGLGLEVGDASCWQEFFPGEAPKGR